MTLLKLYLVNAFQPYLIYIVGTRAITKCWLVMPMLTHHLNTSETTSTRHHSSTKPFRLNFNVTSPYSSKIIITNNSFHRKLSSDTPCTSISICHYPIQSKWPTLIKGQLWSTYNLFYFIFLFDKWINFVINTKII